MKIRCIIEGLDCPHCALELQRKIAAHEVIQNADINFPMKTLVLEVDDNLDEEEVVVIVQAIAQDFEDGITIELRD